jgi:hypothetical protein
MVEYRDRFDEPEGTIPRQPSDRPRPTDGAAGAPSMAFIDRFDQPQQAGSLVQLPPAMPGSGVPDLRPAPVIAPRNPAWPAGSKLGDGTFVQQQQPGTVGYDIDDPNADNFGGDAGVMTTLKASLVPETSPENIQKKLRIYARDMGVPENRFFIDNQGNAAWIDMKGSKHLVVPTVGGGNWADGHDMLRRVGAQTGNAVGSMIAPTVGSAAAPLIGPVGAAAVAGGADALRQIAGNWVAGEDKPWQDLSYSNMAWQAAGSGAVELGSQMTGALIARFLQPGNPYNLRAEEIARLRAIMPQVRGRAGTATDLDLHATPYDLTDLEFLRRLETTVARQPGAAGDIMKQYYDQRADFNFPNGVATLFKRISPEGTPLVGLDKLQRGAEETIGHLRNQQVSQGTQGGWGTAIASGARPDVRQVVAEIQNKIGHTSGPVKQELQRILGELKDGTTLVTDFERLHSIRLDLESTLDGFRRTLPPAERGRMTEVLDPIFAKFNGALDAAHPAYAQGTRAYSQAGQQVAEVRDGILTLLSQNPTLAGNMGKTLFQADPDAVTRARQLFISAGQGDAWEAGTRAVLQGNVTGGAGRNVSGSFAAKTAPHDANRQALAAALPDGVQTDMANVLDLGRAQGRVAHPPNRAEVENLRLEQPGSAPISETARAVLAPFRFMRDMGDEFVQRSYNRNAVEMAMDLTGQRGPKPSMGPSSLMFWRQPPRPAPNGTPSTAAVLQNLENTAASPFTGWQRQLFERSLSTLGAAATRGLLDDPDPTLPTAPDLRRGLLLRPLH